MADLIDRWALRKAIMADYGTVSEEEGESNYQSGLTMAIISVDEAPTVEAIPAADIAAMRERCEAAEHDFGLLKHRDTRICEICRYGDCYCSSGGSACKGFEWRGPDAGGEGKQ